MRIKTALLVILLSYLGTEISSAQGGFFEKPDKLPASSEIKINRNLNRKDEKGRKQGKWQKIYSNGKKAYTANFIDDRPVDSMVRYHMSGKVQAIVAYNKTGSFGKAELFNEKGNLIAKGNYIESNKKDSIWTYFKPNGELASFETYNKGLKHGKSVVYFPNGKISEEIMWMNDLKDGPWIQYFENGEIRMKTQHKQDKMHGMYVFYFENGIAEIKGFYADGLEDGKWTFYNTDGSIADEIEYERGTPKNKELLEKKEQKYLEQLEKNKDKLKDPEDYLNNPDAVMPIP